MRLTALFLLLLLFALVPSVVTAESTINCHCFRDRSFDHQNPEKVVPYLLATTQNSFLAVAFNADKFLLVKELMSGVSSEQLWIANYFAAKYGFKAKSLLSVRNATGSWQAALYKSGIATNKLSRQIATALKIDDGGLQLAAAVVDQTLLDLFDIDAGQLHNLRTAGADNRETILAFFLQQRSGRLATKLYRSVADGSTNWGTLAYINNVNISAMESEFKLLLGR